MKKTMTEGKEAVEDFLLNDDLFPALFLVKVCA